MNDSQIQQRKDEIHYASKQRAKEMGVTQWEAETPEEKQELKELSCREMMTSIFCYHRIDTLKDESDYFFNKYLKPHLDELGRERFDQIRNEQIALYERCTINHNVYEDREGCTYNSINWLKD